MMKTIPRDTLLETDEAKELLKGRIKLEKLVGEYGLTGLAKGYWSNALIWALDRACGILSSERSQGASEEQEVSHGEIFDKEGSNQSWRILGPATTTQLRRSGSNPRNRRSQVLPLGNGTRSVESQLERLDRKASEEVQSQVVGSGG
jgi:hypothetical protein